VQYSLYANTLGMEGVQTTFKVISFSNYSSPFTDYILSVLRPMYMQLPTHCQQLEGHKECLYTLKN